MPMDVRDHPPSPGDGSGICERQETERQRYERKKREARAEYWGEKVKEYKSKHHFEFGLNGASSTDISAFFGRVFGDGDTDD